MQLCRYQSLHWSFTGKTANSYEKQKQKQKSPATALVTVSSTYLLLHRRVNNAEKNKQSCLIPFLVKVAKMNIFKLDFCGFLFTLHLSSNVTFFSGNMAPYSEIIQPRSKSIYFYFVIQRSFVFHRRHNLLAF